MSSLEDLRRSPALPLTFDHASPLLYLHIPKCSGTSALAELRANFPRRERRYLEFRTGHTDRNLVGLGMHSFYSGHVPYSFTRKLPPATRVATILRNPLRRSVSALTYMKAAGVATLRLNGAPEPMLRICDMSIDDFVAAEPEAARQFAGSLQTWMLARDSVIPPEGHDVTDADVRVAKSALDECDFVGLTEKQDESIDLLFKMAGWPRLRIRPHLNISPSYPVSERTLALLKTWAEPDFEVYDHARKIFAELAQRYVDQPDWVPAGPKAVLAPTLRMRGQLMRTRLRETLEDLVS